MELIDAYWHVFEKIMQKKLNFKDLYVASEKNLAA